MSTMTLVDQIIADLEDRSGFSQAFDIDDDVMAELKASLVALIDAHITSREVRGYAVAWSLRFSDDPRLCLSTVFDTEKEAEDYAATCMTAPEIVPLYIHPAAHAAYTKEKYRERPEGEHVLIPDLWKAMIAATQYGGE